MIIAAIYQHLIVSHVSRNPQTDEIKSIPIIFPEYFLQRNINAAIVQKIQTPISATPIFTPPFYAPIL